jgi:hypothetical protein
VGGKLLGLVRRTGVPMPSGSKVRVFGPGPNGSPDARASSTQDRGAGAVQPALAGLGQQSE